MNGLILSSNTCQIKYNISHNVLKLNNNLHTDHTGKLEPDILEDTTAFSSLTTMTPIKYKLAPLQ